MAGPRRSWWRKVLIVLDELLGLLFAGLGNLVFGLRRRSVRFGLLNCTISAILGANKTLNRRTQVACWIIGMCFLNPNHCEEQAVMEGLIL